MFLKDKRDEKFPLPDRNDFRCSTNEKTSTKLHHDIYNIIQQ